MSEQQHPSSALRDCSLPQETMNLINLLLVRMAGLNLHTALLRDPLVYREYRTATRLVTPIDKKPLQPDHLCVFLPSWLLAEETPDRLDALNSLAFSFPTQSFIHVITSNSHYPARAIRRIIEWRWPKVIDGQVNWIVKRDIDDLLKSPVQEDLLRDMLDMWEQATSE